MFAERSCFIRNSSLMPMDMGDELVMLADDEAHFISLNAVGKYIYDLLQKQQSLHSIIRNVCMRYAVSEAQCRSDLELFLKDLLQYRVVLACECAEETA